MRSKIGVIVIIAVFLFCISAYAEDKVGYINVQRTVSETNLGKEARAQIEKLTTQRNKEIEEKNKELESLNNKLLAERQKKNPDLSKIRELIDEIQQKDKELKRFVADAREELTKMDRELANEILQKADPVLREIAKKRGYSIIIKDPNALAYLDSKVDITEEVIKELNKLK